MAEKDQKDPFHSRLLSRASRRYDAGFSIYQNSTLPIDQSAILCACSPSISGSRQNQSVGKQCVEIWSAPILDTNTNDTKQSTAQPRL